MMDGDIPHMSAWVQANTSRFAFRKLASSLARCGSNWDPIFKTFAGSASSMGISTVVSLELPFYPQVPHLLWDLGPQGFPWAIPSGMIPLIATSNPPLEEVKYF